VPWVVLVAWRSLWPHAVNPILNTARRNGTLCRDMEVLRFEMEFDSTLKSTQGGLADELFPEFSE
jgi:hypothetical protein